MWAQILVDVNGQSLSGLELNLRPAMSVSGRVVVDTVVPPVAAVGRRTLIQLRPWPEQSPVAPTARRATVQADGAFRIDGVVPGSYVVSVQPPAPSGAGALMLRSATVDDVDLMANVLDMIPGGSTDGLVITLTDRVTEIAGRLIDASDRPVSEYLVLVFPADRRLWALGAERLRAPVHTATDGLYAVGGLPPGDYYLAALTDVEPWDHLDPDFLELLVPGAIRITLADGERKRQDLRVAREIRRYR